MNETRPGALPLPIVPGLTDLEVFARGGYATVYRATQISVGREVAVKVENRTLDSDRDQARFLREARAAGRMSSHPHVVDLFDVGVTPDQHPYLIMELCDGSYAERMRNSPLDAVEARDLGVKIADALAHAHASGVLHRDVKPANILYQPFNTAVLADFGLAVLAEVRDLAVTLEVLTPAYAPPEMFRHSTPTPAVDVYALCATLYAVMNGKPPRWQADRNPSLVTLMELFNQPIPDLSGVPNALVDVLRTGMSNDPARRPSATQLRELLAAVPLGSSNSPVSGPPVSGPPASGPPASGPVRGTPGIYGTPSTVPRPPGVPPFSDTTPTVPARIPRRRRLRWFLGGLGAFVLMAGIVGSTWAIAGRNGPPTPTPTPTGIGRMSGSARMSASVGTGGALPGCLIQLPGDSRCPDRLECFGPVRERGEVAEAEEVPCAGRHTWETYAEGDVPARLPAANYRTVKQNPDVRAVCAESTFQLVTLRSPLGWNLDVLPPSEEAAAEGDRTYRCLAGKGVDGLTTPTLGRN